MRTAILLGVAIGLATSPVFAQQEAAAARADLAQQQQRTVTSTHKPVSPIGRAMAQLLLAAHQAHRPPRGDLATTPASADTRTADDHGTQQEETTLADPLAVRH